MSDDDYLLPKEVGLIFTEQTKAPFSLFHLNVQSVRNKFDELNIFLDSFSFRFDVIMLTETWYKNTDEVDRLEGYNIFNLNRSDKVGGGIAMYVKKHFKCSVITDFTIITNDYEILTLQHEKSIYSVVYRPPCGNISSFFEILEVFFRFIGENGFTLYFGGDFNIDMHGPSYHKQEMMSLYQSYGLSNVILQPTRVTPVHEALLDLFLTNLSTSEVIAGVVGETISDHLPIFLLSNVSYNLKETRGPEVYFRNISAKNLELFEHHMNYVNWSAVLSSV